MYTYECVFVRIYSNVGLFMLINYVYQKNVLIYFYCMLKVRKNIDKYLSS